MPLPFSFALPAGAVLSMIIFALSPVYAEDQPPAPDTIVFRSGKVLHGLILKYGISTVTFQQAYREHTIPKREILRIYDEADSAAYFAEVQRKGALPPWRTIANDFRTLDAVRQVTAIPATVVTEGDFRHVPYLAFRVNHDMELNIYGDPDDPAGIGLGIYGPSAREVGLRRTLRAYIAGFLTTEEELSALYRVSLDGGRQHVGQMVIEIKAPRDKDAYGRGWWIEIFNQTRVKQARLSSAEYGKLTIPSDEVFDRERKLLPEAAKKLRPSHRPSTGENRVFLHGFHRDENGNFRLPSSVPTVD